MEDMVAQIARCLVAHPEQVEVERLDGDSRVVIALQVAEEDVGQVIGRGGRVATALRTVLRAAASERGQRVALDIVD
jgi:predicted RNA-binding protein YlqC (UPF0109 family)